MLRVGVKRSYNSSSGSIIEEYFTPAEAPSPKRRKVEEASLYSNWWGQRFFKRTVNILKRLFLRRSRERLLDDSTDSVAMNTSQSSLNTSPSLSQQEGGDVMSLPVLTSTPFSAAPSDHTSSTPLSHTSSAFQPCPPSSPPSLNLTTPFQPHPSTSPPLSTSHPDSQKKVISPPQVRVRLSQSNKSKARHWRSTDLVKTNKQNFSSKSTSQTGSQMKSRSLVTHTSSDGPTGQTSLCEPAGHTSPDGSSHHTSLHGSTGSCFHGGSTNRILHDTSTSATLGEDRHCAVERSRLFRPLLRPEVIGPSLLNQSSHSLKNKCVSVFVSSQSILPSDRDKPKETDHQIAAVTVLPHTSPPHSKPSPSSRQFNSSLLQLERLEKIETEKRRDAKSADVMSETGRSYTSDASMKRYNSTPSDKMKEMFSFLERMKIEHERSVEDKRSIAEAIEKKLQFHKQQRMELEDARVARLRHQLVATSVDERKTFVETLAPLNESQLAKVAMVTRGGPSSECLSQKYNIRVTRGDLATLIGLQWLNDEVINFYFNLVKDRSLESGASRKVHVFNSFFYPKLSQSGYSGVRRWTRKVDIFSFDLILLPVHLGMHWCCALIDFNNKRIGYYDSLHGNNAVCLQRLSDYLVAESRDKKGVEFDASGWSQITPKDIPHQENGSDCGVFTCMYARYLAVGSRFTFSQANMSTIREHMIAEILEQTLF